MNTRRGLGKGLGTGYKNLVPMDTHIHSLSAKGVKTKSPSVLVKKMVGDGKTPNKYFVTVGEDYYYYNKDVGGYDWVSDKYKGYNFKGKTLKMFNTFEEAKEFADTLKLNNEVEGVNVKSVQIEDRLSGQVYERTQTEEGGVVEHTDIKFTAEQEKKKKAKQTIRKKLPKTNPVNAGNLMNYIMDYEGGNPTQTDVVYLFSYLVKTGQAWSLQGMYGRQASAMIDAGVLDKKGNINWDKVPMGMVYDE